MPVRPSPKFRDSIPHFGPPKVPAVTARQVSKSDGFIKACLAQDVKPTKRQASKYLRRSGRWAGAASKSA